MKRLGSELTSDCDKLLPDNGRIPLKPDCLPFSNGRAALAWVCDKFMLRSAVLCAYTCSSLPKFFRNRGMGLDMFDVGASMDEINQLAMDAEAPCLVLIPALFGMEPTINQMVLWGRIGTGGLVVVDAMQTAFGHETMPGAVLSGPRKCTGLPDGAIFTIPGARHYLNDMTVLPTAIEPVAHKFWADLHWRRDESEKAVERNRSAEALWPETPHKMSIRSTELYERFDRAWHGDKRRSNARRLMMQLPPWMLDSRLAVWLSDSTVPYSLPILVKDPNKLLQHLHAQRIFATRLWPDSEHDPKMHPVAHMFCEHLVSLPVDQRHEPEDMDRIARGVLEVAQPMEGSR